MTRSRDVADTQDNSGGPVPPITAGKNGVINGAFDIWQRGTSISYSANQAYNADRWLTQMPAAGTVSRQLTNDTTNLPFIQYCARVQRTSGQTATSGHFLYQNFESINSIPFAGRTVTYSFYARAGANYSATSNALVANLYSGTGTDQNVLSTYTGFATVATTTATLTTTWQRFSVTGTVATSATELSLGFSFTPTGTAGANDWYEITGVQLEVGRVATPFSRAGGTYGGELALCQRYYYRTTFGAGDRPLGYAGIGQNSAGGQGHGVPKVTMRGAATSVDFSNIKADEPGVNSYAITSVTLGNTQGDAHQFAWVTGGTQIGTGRSYILQTNTGGGFIGFSAEL